MKIPTSPLLFTLALSSSTLAYPTPAKSSPNPENSPLLGGDGSNNMDGDLAWGTRPEKMPGRLGSRWGRRQIPQLTGKNIGSTLSQPSSLLGGAGAGPVQGPGTITAEAQGLLTPVQGLLAPATGIIGSTGLGTTLGNVPIVGGLVGGLLGQNPGAAPNVNGQTPGGLLGGTLGNVPIVGGLVGGLLGQTPGATPNFNGQNPGGLLGGTLGNVPIVGGLLGQPGGLLGGLGSTIGGATGIVSGLPVVGGLVGGLTNNLAAGALPEQAQSYANGGAHMAMNAATGVTGDEGAGDVPKVVANLGDGRYLTSAGQILNLGNLANLQGARGGLLTGFEGQLGNLGGGVAGGVLGSNLGQVQSQAGQLGGVGPAALIGPTLGQVQAQAQGQAVQLSSGPLGTVQSALGNTPLSGAVRYLNINGQLIPINAAGQIINQAGFDGFMHYAADPSSSTDDSTTPAEAFESSEADNNNSTAAAPAAKTDEGYNNPFPGINEDTDATQSVAGTMGGGEKPHTLPGSEPSAEMVNAQGAGPSRNWAKPSGSMASNPGPTATPSPSSGTRSGQVSGTPAWSEIASSTISQEPWYTPAPTSGGEEDGQGLYQGNKHDGQDMDEGWGEWVSASSSAIGNAVTSASASASAISAIWR